MGLLGTQRGERAQLCLTGAWGCGTPGPRGVQAQGGDQGEAERGSGEMGVAHGQLGSDRGSARGGGATSSRRVGRGTAEGKRGIGGWGVSGLDAKVFVRGLCFPLGLPTPFPMICAGCPPGRCSPYQAPSSAGPSPPPPTPPRGTSFLLCSSLRHTCSQSSGSLLGVQLSTPLPQSHR